MEMVLPSNYAAIDQEEMMYLDGGAWSASTLKKSMNNLSGKVGSGAFRFAFGSLAVSTAWGYWTAVSVLGGKVAAGLTVLASSMTGPLGIAVGAAAALGASGAIYFMGTKVRFG